MRVKYLGILLLLTFLIGLLVNQAQAQPQQRDVDTPEKVTLPGRVVEVNEEHQFVIINLGSTDGIEKGMDINVFRGDGQVAKIKANKVRSHISACDIQVVYTGRGIAVGDVVVYKESAAPLKVVKRALKPLEPAEPIEVEPIIVDIDAPRQTILRKALTVFEEFGTLITESDPKAYTLKAHKSLKLPLDMSLFTEYRPVVRNKVYYSVEVTSTPRYNRLIIRLRGVYDSEGQVYNRQINRGCATYKEAQTMAFTIKDLAEKL